MASIEKLKSGKYRARVYNAKEHKQVSFTADTKRELERKVNLFLVSMDQEPEPERSLFKEAADKYIDNREAVLSPGTVREYKRMLKHDLEKFYYVSLNNIDNNVMQQFINDISHDHAPKTVRCIYSFMCAVIRTEMPSKRFQVDLPKRIRNVFKVPSEGDVKRLMKEVENTEMEIPVLLALFGPMRRSEIAALDMEYVNGNVVHVHFALAQDEYGEWVKKSPKTYSGDRYIEYPEWVIKKLPKTGAVTNLTPTAITARFPHIMKRIGLNYTFHQMRHWSVSYLHKMGLSDQEILDRAGWQSTTIFKEVYRHGVAGEDRATKIFNDFSSDV